MSLEVKYIDVPEGAQENAQFQAQTGQPFSVAQELSAGVQNISWATLESGGWPLDGTRKLIPNNPQEMGWWSAERSGEDSTFSQPPVLEILFSEVYTATGITFTFWPGMRHWCSHMRVNWYNGQMLLEQVEVCPDGPVWVLQQTVTGFDRITITILATNVPNQFAKLQKIQIGQVVVFGREELVKVNLVNEVDPSLCQLRVGTMCVQIRDRAGRDLAPQKNQKMELIKDGNLLAVQYIDTASREEKQFYTFSCQSVIGRLEDDFLGGVYTAEPVQSLLQNVLGAYSFELDEALQNETITGYLPVLSRRQALQQIAFAIGAAVYVESDGVISLRQLPESVDAAFTGSQIFPGAKVSTAPVVASVQVYSHSYAPAQETQTLLREHINAVNQLYVFSQPYHSYTISGGTLVDSGVNWVRITANGEVTLSARKYDHTTAVYTKQNPAATAAEKGNVVTVSDATLVHSKNVENVLERLFTAKQMVSTLTQDVVVSGHRAGQKVISVNPWGTSTEGVITAMDSQLTQSGHTANVTIRGREVSGK